MSKIHSFLFAVWPSILLTYQLLPSVLLTYQVLPFVLLTYHLLLFWGLIACCPSVPHVPPWAGVYSAKRAGKYMTTALIGLPALRWIQAPAVGPSCGDAPTWAGMIPSSFPLLGRDVPGHTLTRTFRLSTLNSTKVRSQSNLIMLNHFYSFISSPNKKLN